MTRELGAQDEALGNLYDELLALDEEVQSSIHGFIGGFEKTVSEVGEIVGKGCRATISKDLDGVS